MVANKKIGGDRESKMVGFVSCRNPSWFARRQRPSVGPLHWAQTVVFHGIAPRIPFSHMTIFQQRTHYKTNKVICRDWGMSRLSFGWQKSEAAVAQRFFVSRLFEYFAIGTVYLEVWQDRFEGVPMVFFVNRCALSVCFSCLFFPRSFDWKVFLQQRNLCDVRKVILCPSYPREHHRTWSPWKPKKATGSCFLLQIESVQI